MDGEIKFPGNAEIGQLYKAFLKSNGHIPDFSNNWLPLAVELVNHQRTN